MGIRTVVRVVRRYWKSRIALLTSPHLRIGPGDAVSFQYIWMELSEDQGVIFRGVGRTHPEAHAGTQRQQHS